MALALLFLLELAILSILAARFFQAIYLFVLLCTSSKTAATTTITVLAFPGTVIHELAHLFTAEVLGVRTGKLSLVPESIDDDEIQAGSVMIAHTDPFRRSAIGCAPLFAGVATIMAVSALTPQTIPYWAALYLMFVVSNSMFASREDLKGFAPFFATILIMGVGAYLAGVRIGITGSAQEAITRVASQLATQFGLVVGLHVVGLIILKLLNTFIRSIRGNS